MSRKISHLSKKSRKTCQQQPIGEDYITKLPETIITNILSRLPTVVAARTSVLSREWEYKWTSIYNIHIKDRKTCWECYSRQRSTKSSFVNFVDRVFFLSHGLKSFRLSCSERYDSSRLTGWISSALKCSIECFELEAMDQIGLVLPRSLLNKTSLRKLELKVSCTFKVPREICFPNLTHLHLCKVEVLNMFSSNDILVFTLPVLETLQVKNCIWSSVNLVEIRSPRLTTFKCETDLDDVVNGVSVKICGARIDSFESSGGFPERIIFYESVVVNAAFLNKLYQYFHDSENDESDDEVSDLQRGLNVRKVLKEFSGVTDLELSDSMCEYVALSTQEVSFPRYDRLQRLVVCVRNDTKLLFELLHSAPSLKILEIDMVYRDGIFVFEVDSVPSCVISHLEEVTLVNARRDESLKVAKFFLENGVELKKIRLRHSSFTKDIVGSLLKIPRASACLAFVTR